MGFVCCRIKVSKHVIIFPPRMRLLDRLLCGEHANNCTYSAMLLARYIPAKHDRACDAQLAREALKVQSCQRSLVLELNKHQRESQHTEAPGGFAAEGIYCQNPCADDTRSNPSELVGCQFICECTGYLRNTDAHVSSNTGALPQTPLLSTHRRRIIFPSRHNLYGELLVTIWAGRSPENGLRKFGTLRDVSSNHQHALLLFSVCDQHMSRVSSPRAPVFDAVHIFICELCRCSACLGMGSNQ
jgi:hypothetical protein